MKFFSLILTVFIGFGFLNAQTDAATVFIKSQYISMSGDTLPYRQLNPLVNFDDCGTEKRYPLVIFLHGSGERGNDNEKQLIHGSKMFADVKNRVQFPAFVIFPQCAENKRWVEVDWNLPAHDMPAEPSKYLQLVMDVIDVTCAKYPIDPDRIYVAGLSMGGFGTWDLISRFPDKFAAAIPICGGADLNQATNIKQVPVWTFHGANDKVVKTQRTRDMVAAVKKAGGNMKYTEYPGVGHDSWNKTFAEPELLKWLFSQNLQNRK